MKITKHTEFVVTPTSVDLVLGDDEVGEQIKKMSTDEIASLVEKLISDLRSKDENGT
jgi:hypothetical protein